MNSNKIGLLAIFLGGLIYVLLRNTNMIMFDWFTYAGIETIIHVLRKFVNPVKDYLPTWVYYSLPNSLWLFGGILLLSQIWLVKSMAKLIWILVFIFISIGSEFAQLFAFIPGTFDITDILFMVIFITFSFKFIFKEKHEYEKSNS